MVFAEGDAVTGKPLLRCVCAGPRAVEAEIRAMDVLVVKLVVDPDVQP